MEIKSSIWNQVDLAPPPVCTVKSKWCKEIKILNSTLEKITSTLDSFDIVLRETKLLSAILKQLKGELRLDKIYQLASKVIQCVKKCEVLNLKDVILRTKKTSSQCTAFDHQPSRQMLEYNLVRIQGFINLLKFLVDLCHQCAIHLKGKMEVGHFPALVLALFSIVSRIWSVSNYFLENAFEWYLLLLPSLKYLEPTPITWLPSGFEFPALPLELEQVPWINQNKILTSLSSFLSDFDEPATPSSNLQFLTKLDDLGEKISRKDLVSTGCFESRFPSQHKHTLVQGKSISAVKIVAGLNETTSKPTKRKVFELDPGEEDSDVSVKHFFKTKYTRPLTAQKPQVSEQQVKKVKLGMETVSSNPVNNGGNNESGVPDFMQELAKLKQDLAILDGQSKSTSVERAAIDPKIKRKAVVVKDKKSSVCKKPLQRKVEKSDLQRRIAKVEKDVGERVDLDETRSVNVPVVKGMPVIRAAPAVESVPKQRKVLKKKRSQELLQKRKEVVKLKKQKSKSWVIS